MSARDAFFVQSRLGGLCTESREWYVPFPSLHHRKEGWLRHQRNFAKPPKLTQPGWFPLDSFGKPPRPRDQRRLRDIFLIARPPLLAVDARRGLSVLDSQFIRTFHGQWRSRQWRFARRRGSARR